MEEQSETQSEVEPKIESDIDLEPVESEIEDARSSPPVFEISTYPADFTLEVLGQKLGVQEIKIPPYQRGFVWKLPQASRLIESFMMGLPVPQIFLYTDKDQTLLVIDGQQRLKTVSYFFEGYFGQPTASGTRRIFRLQGLNEKSRWHHKTFREFDETDKRKLKNSVLRAIIVRQLDPKDNTSVYHIFERLNTGGTLLTGQEVRNCVYFGKLNDLLIELNQSPNWREILGKPVADSRQKDVELILRYMTLYHEEPNYTKPMKDFLSTFMSEHRNPSPQFLEEEKNRFTGTCELVLKVLGRRPFNPRGPLNGAVFDSVFVAFARHKGPIPSDIKERYSKLLSDRGEFFELTRLHTTDVEAVHARFALVTVRLFS